jgi:pyruvate dehydrogenase E1 component alpha subunit
LATIDASVLIGMYTTAFRIKECDDRLRSMKQSGELPGAWMFYSPRGQEFVAAGMAANLTPDDYVVTTYRGLHDQVAKGVPLRVLWAEFAGKASGTCKGKGGSMHITDVDSGVMVTTGVVGSGLPIANGLALASKLRGESRVTVANFGDGASNIGAFHEALNLAAVWCLPVVFVCQNNLWSEHTRLEEGTAVTQIAERGAAYDMPAINVDGNDPIAMYSTAKEAVERARRGEGPTLIEAMTYKFWGHYFGDTMKYIPASELEAAKQADPVPVLRARLLDEEITTDEELVTVEARIVAEVDDAARFALESEPPDAAEALTDIYAVAL